MLSGWMRLKWWLTVLFCAVFGAAITGGAVLSLVRGNVGISIFVVFCGVILLATAFWSLGLMRRYHRQVAERGRMSNSLEHQLARLGLRADPTMLPMNMPRYERSADDPKDKPITRRSVTLGRIICWAFIVVGILVLVFAVVGVVITPSALRGGVFIGSFGVVCMIAGYAGLAEVRTARLRLDLADLQARWRDGSTDPRPGPGPGGPGSDGPSTTG